MRRNALASVAVALVLANVAFFTLKTTSESAGVSTKVSEAGIQEFPADWVAFMPSFESSQRADPVVFGTHSPLPSQLRFDVLVDGQPVSRLSFLAGRCGVEQYAIRNSNDAGGDYMPDRLFAQSLSRDQQECLRANLPNGYQLSELSKALLPSHTSWSTDISKLIVDASGETEAR